VAAGDDGKPFLSSGEESPSVAAFAKIVDAVEKRMPAVTPLPIFKTAGTGIAAAKADGDCGCQSHKH
jgi:hypothetical protein